MNFVQKGIGIDITLMEMFLLMNADDIIIMAETPEDLQLG